MKSQFLWRKMVASKKWKTIKLTGERVKDCETGLKNGIPTGFGW